MTWDQVQHIGIPLLGAIALIVAPIIGRRAAHKTAEAAMRSSLAQERESEAARWQLHTESVQRYADGMADRLGLVEGRLDEAELRYASAEVRAVTADLRATKAESLYTASLVYLRRISVWVNDHMPGIVLPPPPTELEADLGRHHDM